MSNPLTLIHTGGWKNIYQTEAVKLNVEVTLITPDIFWFHSKEGIFLGKIRITEKTFTMPEMLEAAKAQLAQDNENDRQRRARVVKENPKKEGGRPHHFPTLGNRRMMSSMISIAAALAYSPAPFQNENPQSQKIQTP